MYKLRDLLNVPGYQIVEDSNVVGVKIGWDYIKIHPNMTLDDHVLTFITELNDKPNFNQAVCSAIINKWEMAIERLHNNKNVDPELLKKLIEKDVPEIVQDHIKVINVLKSPAGCKVVIRRVRHYLSFAVYCKWDDNEQQYVLVTDSSTRGKITAQLNKLHIKNTEQQIIENATISERSASSIYGIERVRMDQFVFRPLLRSAVLYETKQIAKDVHVKMTKNDLAHVVVPDMRIAGAKIKWAINMIGPKTNRSSLETAKYHIVHGWETIFTDGDSYFYKVPQKDAEKQFCELLQTGRSSNPLLDRFVEVADKYKNMYILQHKNTKDDTNMIHVVVKLHEDQKKEIEVLASIRKEDDAAIVVFNREPSEDELKYVLRYQLTLKLSGV